MKRLFLFTLLITCSRMAISQAISQKNQAIRYSNIQENAGAILKNAIIALRISIRKATADGQIVYTERQVTKTDSTGLFHIEIGRGLQRVGQFDSIIWSDGVYYLGTETDPAGGNNYRLAHNALLRVPPELSNDYEQGTVAASDHKEWGEWRFKNNRNKRPKLVTIDLSTAYSNLAYPANTYPVYRHYEWCDPQLTGTGNAFTISFSENTSNDFEENTGKLGEVRLYAIPFQELSISSTNSEIVVAISKPVAVSNLGETYAIKGPWKFIYYIEW